MSTSHKDYGMKKIEDPCTKSEIPKPPDLARSTAYFNPLNKLYYV